MKALLLIAHGSRRPESNDELAQLAWQLKTDMTDQFPIIESGFLEIAQPSIAQAIDHCAAQGATELRVVPYFLAAGRHVSKDLPAMVNAAAGHHPQLSVSIADHVGASVQMRNIVQECALAQG